MALVFVQGSSSSPASASISLSPLFFLTLNVSANPMSRLDKSFLCLESRHFHGLKLGAPSMVKGRSFVIHKAFADSDGAYSDAPYDSSQSEDENAANLPMDSKLQLKLERKMKTKFSKKIRLRRKKLGRKRMLRKKGSWPPSKMQKNKNV